MSDYKKEFIDNLIQQVRSINIHSVMESRISLRGTSHNRFALCPFHADTKIGSFSGNSAKGIFKCFSCDSGGDGIKFISLFDGINYVEAAFQLGLDYGLISENEYQEYYGRRRFKTDEISNFEQRYAMLDLEKMKNNIAEPYLLDKIYRIFIDAARSQNNGSLLNESHKEYLSSRNLSDSDMEHYEFFTFPNRRAMKEIVDKCMKFKKGIDVLKEIPGFFFDKKTDKFTFSYTKGIGLPVKNALGQIIGIQIRKDEVKEDKPRYTWFSSSFAIDNTEKFAFGTSSGAPIDVIYPAELKNNTIFITEGKFKSIALADRMGSIVLSVQGVTAWRKIINELKQLNESHYIKSIKPDYMIQNILLAFDADMSYNINVFTQAEKLTTELQKEVTERVFYLFWDVNKGKGIDDFLLENKVTDIQRYEKKEWDNMYHKILNSLNEKYIVTKEYEKLQKIPKELIEPEFNEFIKTIQPLLKK